MSVTTTTHLNFRGEARAALEHYQSVFGGSLAVVTYADAGRVTDPAEADQVTFGQVVGDDGFRVMAYDVPSAQPFDRGTSSFFVSVRAETAEEAAGLWERLTEGAEVTVPLGPSQWAPAYGMLTDRFGVVWVVDVAVPWNG